MSNLRYFMSKSLTHNRSSSHQNDKIKNRITDVIRFFMVGVKFQKSNFLHWIKTLVNSIKEDKNLILLREINFFYGEYLVSQL